MPSAGFEPVIPEIERPRTRALDRTATSAFLSSPVPHFGESARNL